MEFNAFIGRESDPTCGAWVDLTDDAAVAEAVAKYSDNGAHDVGVMDSEGFDGLRASLGELTALAQYLVDADDGDARLAYALHHYYTTPEEIEAGFGDAYCGSWRSEEAYTEETFRDLYRIPDELDMYIDWKGMARDWFMSDYFSIPDGAGNVYVFRNC